jgi:predicted nucleic acid-binding protein
VNNTPLVYIDTVVFIYRLLPDPDHVDFANLSMGFFDDVDGGKYQGTTSTFTKIEYIGAVKKLISFVNKRQLTTEEEQNAIDDFDELVDHLDIFVSDSDRLVYSTTKPPLFCDTSKIVKASNPYFHLRATERRQWMNIGGSDALSVSLAIRSGAKLFATFDRGFKGLRDTSITPLIIHEEYENV